MFRIKRGSDYPCHARLAKVEPVTRRTFGEQGETIDNNETTVYNYDNKGHLTSAENNSTKWEYTYDGRGNILTAKEYAVSVNDNGEKLYTLKTDGNNTFVYGNTWQDMLTSFNGESITYDAIGNPLSYKGNTLTWTMGRQLAAYGTNTYTYNEDGIRTSKTVNGVTTQYYLNGTDIIQQSDGTNTLYFYYDNASEVVGFNYNNNDYFYVKNMMDDIVAIVDSTGTVVAEYTYSPWGEVTSVTGSNVTLGELNPFRYRSYYYDSDIEMYYLQSRYYDPEICRFINCDDVNYIGLTESEISYNPFAYCENNPINNSDKTGFFRVPSFLYGMLIDAALLFISKSLSITWIAYFAPLKYASKKFAAKYFALKIIPKFKNITGLIKKLIYKALCSLGKMALAASMNMFFKGIIAGITSIPLRIVTALTSLGGAIAALLDWFTDRKFDGWIRVW